MLLKKASFDCWRSGVEFACLSKLNSALSTNKWFIWIENFVLDKDHTYNNNNDDEREIFAEMWIIKLFVGQNWKSKLLEVV